MAPHDMMQHYMQHPPLHPMTMPSDPYMHMPHLGHLMMNPMFQHAMVTAAMYDPYGLVFPHPPPKIA